MTFNLFILLFSLATLLVSALIMLIAIARLPTTYFIKEINENRKSSMLINTVSLIVGIILIILGIIMLFTPGQGIISILIGKTLLPIRQKNHLINKLIKIKTTQKTLNYLRKICRRNSFNFNQP